MPHDNRPERAMFNDSPPTNSLPFAKRLVEILEMPFVEGMTDPDARACLWVLNYLAFGQVADINMSSEWFKLREIFDILT